MEPEPDMFWRHSVDVRFGLRNMELEPEEPEPDSLMSGSSSSAAGVSGLSSKLQVTTQP